MRAVAAVACLTVFALAGCGEDDEAATPAPPAEFASVRITYDRDGKGGRPPLDVRVRCGTSEYSSACDALAQLEPADFAPVPDDVACTMQYGGPQTATVEGTLRGERIDARFSRENGCEITRWERVAPLFEAVR